jgi:hypothetical protein
MCVIITVAWYDNRLLLNDFGLYGIITVAMVMALKEAFKSYILLCRNNVLKQITLHQSSACYVHVLLYNAEKQTDCVFNPSQYF